MPKTRCHGNNRWSVISRIGFLVACLLVTLSAIGFGQEGEPTREYRNWLRRRPEIDRVRIIGNSQIETGKIESKMETKPSGSIFARLGLQKRRRLIRGAINRDVLAISRYYKTEGFWQARISGKAVRDTTSNRAIIQITIDEGERFYWGSMTLSGSPPGTEQQLRSKVNKLKYGNPADTLELLAAQVELRATAADRAYPYVKVGVQQKRHADTIDIGFELTPGPLAYFGDLKVEGNKRTNDNVITRELSFDTGDKYSRHKLLESQQNVYATGMFSFARLNPASADTLRETHPDFILNVIERKPNFAGLKVGAGQDAERDLTVDLGGELGSRNWLGTGRRWSLSAQWGIVVVTDFRIEKNRYEASFTEPWIFNQRLPTTLRFGYEPAVRQGLKPYRVETIDADLNISRRFRQHSRLGLSFIFEKKNLFGIDREANPELIAEEDRQANRKVAITLERDSRPNIFNPRSGSLTLLSAEYVGGFLGGDASYSKIDATWSRYQRLAPSVFATRIRMAWAHEHSGDQNVPTDERYRLGGGNSIRGYSELGVGPQDAEGKPLGGKYVLLTNVELRTPLIWQLWYSMFVDAGNDWSSMDEIRFDNILVSFGGGLQFMTPIGPLRVDYARRVHHPGHPRSDRVHLSILYAF